MSVLQSFHPTVHAWFEASYATPTAVQAASWPRIAAGGHLLITAPTGSGKTLTAFLWALNRFADGSWEPGRTRVVYVSPLKALNNDIQRNLLEPLRELQAQHAFPAVRVATRSGDTKPGDRQRMLRRPPDILITTPESLSLLLTTTRGRHALATTETVIIDEVHSMVDNRRGAQLMTSVERLCHVAGEVQRIALSATVNPLDAVARYVGGYDPQGQPRCVDIVAPAAVKDLVFRVRFPEQAKIALENGKKIWDPLSETFRDVIEGNEATLFFTNSRRLAEKITLKINEDLPGPVAYAHHGSLAREIRTEVETRLKSGQLKAIVATSSLEMGIDIGHLDEVVMVQSPPSVASTLQRLGRAGHRVGETSLGTLYPTHARDFLAAAVLAGSIAKRDIEPLRPLSNALDVLAQVIVSMCATESWQVDDVFQLVRQSAAYHELPREHFDLVIEMLGGRYAGTRVRELQPRLAIDRISGTIRANKGAVFAFYNSGGTIPDRGYFQLRHNDTGAVIGELDEEFVWEATVGDTFSLGTQNWQVVRITHNDVLVRAARPGTVAPPFWRAESASRSFHFSERIGEYLEFAEAAFEQNRATQLRSELMDHCGFDATAAAELIDYLDRQRRHTGVALPHRHHVLIEHIRSGPGGYRGPDVTQQVVIHTLWGSRLNRPWALALASAWWRRFGTRPEIHADDDAVVIQLKDDPDPTGLTTLVTPENVEDLLRDSLEHSGFFGARFRECAGRALLLTRQRFNQRLPLWMSRLQAKKLMSATRGFSDFPLLLETWRTCLNDEFDLDALRMMLGELADGIVRWSCVATATPSPFAANVTFDQISRYMYADDTPEAGEVREPSALADDLIRSAVFNGELRPKVRRDIVDQFINKRQRRSAGYQPVEPEDWLEWCKERILIPEVEIGEVGEVVEHPLLTWLTEKDPQPDSQQSPRRWLTHRELLHGLRTTGLAAEVLHDGDVPEVSEARTAEQLAMEILSFYGPLTAPAIKRLLPSVPDALLDDTEQLICGALIADDDAIYYCDADNYEILLRMQRAALRPEVTTREPQDLPGFLACWQGFGHLAGDDRLLQSLDQLSAFTASVQVWLRDLLPARFPHIADHQIDDALARNEIHWLGVGPKAIALGYTEDLQLIRQADTSPPELEPLFADRTARYGFLQLADQRSGTLDEFNQLWWQSVWQGDLTADSLLPLRQGLERRFLLTSQPTPSADRFASRRSGRLRRATRSSLGWGGTWALTPRPDDTPGPLEQLEDAKDRARLLLDRYGILSRELANREGGRFGWRNLFRALRLMELAGEVVAGHFFGGLSGPQFISAAALNLFQRGWQPPEHFWMNATDPAAPCGLSLQWPELPQRRGQNFLAFRAGALALVVENSGRRLTFLVAADDAELPSICAPITHLIDQRKRVQVEIINGEPARRSPFVEPLARMFRAVNDHKQIYLEKR